MAHNERVGSGARRGFHGSGLAISLEPDDPIALWHAWLDDAIAAGIEEPTAAVVSTVDPSGHPDGRFVLVRGVDDSGFSFYTNLESVKSHHLGAVPYASLVFGWLELHRSVRVRGPVARVADDVADVYFAGRPRGSQVSAWASAQSSVIADRAVLEDAVAEVEKRFDGVEVPRPPFWGGWRVVPDSVEFWQGQVDRLHDRLLWTRNDQGWSRARLAP
jgi:pyridoxamine 5'-phosphate oxidase